MIPTTRQNIPAATLGESQTVANHSPNPQSGNNNSEISHLFQWPNGTFQHEYPAAEPPDGHDDQGWKWRSGGSRSQGIPDGAEKVDHKSCHGVIHCGCMDEHGRPSHFSRPKSDISALTRQLATICHICQKSHTHISCTATLTTWRYQRDNWREYVVRRHVGEHGHAQPPTAKLSHRDLQAVDKQVRQNPQLTTQQLWVGADPNQTLLSVINPILLDACKARSVVDSSKVRQGIRLPLASRNSGFQLLEVISDFRSLFKTPWIQQSDFVNGQYVLMQTPFQHEVLLRDTAKSWQHEVLEVESPQHGIIMDGSHDFFTKGILLVSLTFSQVGVRWMPVLYTWLGEMDTPHHQIHFLHLFKGIEVAASEIGRAHV